MEENNVRDELNFLSPLKRLKQEVCEYRELTRSEGIDGRPRVMNFYIDGIDLIAQHVPCLPVNRFLRQGISNAWSSFCSLCRALMTLITTTEERCRKYPYIPGCVQTWEKVPCIRRLLYAGLEHFRRYDEMKFMNYNAHEFTGFRKLFSNSRKDDRQWDLFMQSLDTLRNGTGEIYQLDTPEAIRFYSMRKLDYSVPLTMFDAAVIANAYGAELTVYHTKSSEWNETVNYRFHVGTEYSHTDENFVRPDWSIVKDTDTDLWYPLIETITGNMCYGYGLHEWHSILMHHDGREV